MSMTYILKVYKGESLQTTMCFDDPADAVAAEETFKQAGNTVVLISEQSDDLSFDECADDEHLS